MNDPKGIPAAERALRERGSELVLRLTAVLRVARAYSAGNQVFKNQLEALHKTLHPLFATTDEAVFVVFEGGLFLNGVRVPTSSGNFHHVQALTNELERRGIAGFETRGEPTIDEWREFFAVFLDADTAPGAPFVEALKQRRLEHLFAALRVIDEAPDDCSGALAPGPGDDGASAATDPGTSESSRHGARGGRTAETVTAGRGAAPKRYAAALRGLQSLLTRTTAQDGLELRHAKRVVQPLIDGVEDKDPIVLGLVGMQKRDDYTYTRMVNAVLIAVTIGQRIGLDRMALSDLGVATLFQGLGRDGGKDPARWGIEGALRIAHSTAFNRSTLRAMQVALESNAAPDDLSPRCVMAQIVAIATTYARLVSARSEAGKAVTPAQALGAVLGPLAPGFRPALRSAIVESLGYHPPGQCVELDTGQIALVVAPRREDLARPIVRVVAGASGRPLLPGEGWEGGPLPDERSIVRDLTAEETPEIDFAA